MRESIGASFVVYAIVIFVAIFSLFFIMGLNYTKAFKMKNRIVDIIEENECYEGGDCASSEQIATALKEAGYRMKGGKPDCNRYMKGRNGKVISSENHYCVYKVTTSRGDYYGAVTFMYFEIPLFNIHKEYPVYGETKVMGKF